MKPIRPISLCLVLLPIVVLLGCGGGSGVPSGSSAAASGTGKATITVQWPARTRLIPLAANSISVAITQGASVYTQQLLARPTTGNVSSVTFNTLPTGTLGITASAFPNADGTGVVQAAGTAPLVIQANQTTNFSVTMSSTITHVVVGTVFPVWNGRTSTLSASAFDASNNLVLTTPSKWSWTSASTGVATVTSGTNQTTITGVSVGTSVVTVKETESNVSGQATISVIKPGLAALPWSKFQANSSNSGLGSGVGATGATKWSFPTLGKLYASMAIGADSTVYVGSSDGSLYAVNSNGTQRWSFATGGQVSCPAIGADGTIYVGSGDGKVYAVNPDGSLKWSTVTVSGIFSNPSIGSDGTVYAASFQGTLNALDGLTGAKKWAFTTGSLIYGSPALAADGTIYIGCDNTSSNINTPTNKLFAINPDGTQKWTFSNGFGIDSACAVGSDGTIYVGTYDNKLHAINNSGTEIWSNTFSVGPHLPITAPAIAADGTVYFGSAENHLYAVHSNGTSYWSFTLGGQFASPPAIGGDGTIYVGYSDTPGTGGQFYAVSPTGVQKWAITTGPVAGASAVGSDGTVYITSGVDMLALK